MVLISVLAIGSIGSAQDLPTDVGKGANDVGAETVDKDSTRGAEDFANGVAYATDKAARVTAPEHEEGAAVRLMHSWPPVASGLALLLVSIPLVSILTLTPTALAHRLQLPGSQKRVLLEPFAVSTGERNGTPNAFSLIASSVTGGFITSPRAIDWYPGY